MSGTAAQDPSTRRGRHPAVLSTERAEQLRVAAETMAVGVLVLLFSLPVVTAGAAWCAAAEVTAGWHHGREPGLVRAFCRVVRRDLVAGLVVAAAAVALPAAAWLEARVVLRTRMPGYVVEAGALVALGAAALGFVLLTVAGRAATAGHWSEAVRTAAHQVRTAPSTLPLAVTACVFTAALVAVVPAFAGFMAGPLAYAVSAVVGRNLRRPRAL